MRAAGRTQVAVLVGGVVAVAFDAFGEEDVAHAVTGELPQRGQRCRTAAEDEGVAVVRALRGGRGERAVTQQVAKRQADAVHA